MTHQSFGVRPHVYEASRTHLLACVPRAWCAEQVRTFLTGEYEGRENDFLQRLRSACPDRPMFNHVSMEGEVMKP